MAGQQGAQSLISSASLDLSKIVTALPSPLPDDPLPLVARWLNDAMASQVQPNPNAMTLATATPGGQPSARVVLIKDFNSVAGFLVFYSHYTSRKGRELERNPLAAAVVHWDTLGRQLRFEGRVARSPCAESDAYFQSRPWLSQLNAWASDQSEPITGPSTLLAQARQRAAELDRPVDADLQPLSDGAKLPRPEHWGGFRLTLSAVEFWVHGDGRFHDRLGYRRDLGPDGGSWSRAWLQP
jgi:pyridoxamine 5'-phosphate oxidase